MTIETKFNKGDEVYYLLPLSDNEKIATKAKIKAVYIAYELEYKDNTKGYREILVDEKLQDRCFFATRKEAEQQIKNEKENKK